MQPETVDDIIRKKARARLQAELQALVAPLRERLPAGGLELRHFVDGSGRRTTARGALEEILGALYGAEVAAYEQAAVNKFIASHETLQASLDELKVEAAPIEEMRSATTHSDPTSRDVGHDHDGGSAKPSPAALATARQPGT